ncbi:Sec63 [Tulasnella sp. JGI-2019a]|nr:Sec63 [Tulasnella sp. JGI-2019a]
MPHQFLPLQQLAPAEHSSDHMYSSPSPNQRYGPLYEQHRGITIPRGDGPVEQTHVLYDAGDSSQAYEYGEDYAYHRDAPLHQLPQQYSDSRLAPRFINQQHSPRAAENLHSTRTSNGIRLVPVSDLPDVYRPIFKFGAFNAIQSSCYDTAMHSDVNMVISGMMRLVPRSWA